MTDHDDTRILTNARIVLADTMIESGWLVMTGKGIAEIGEGRAPEVADVRRAVRLSAAVTLLAGVLTGVKR